MKTDRKILMAFILNLLFSVFEFAGGIVTGSVAISSDAVHDIGDAVSIGISYLIERKSKEGPDAKYTYGYARYSVLGAFISTTILLVGSVVMIFGAVARIIIPNEINYDGMIIFAAVGTCVNLCAAVVTGGDGTLNQKAVNLHMLEDVLGWIVVLIGAVVMRFTGFSLIDPIMSAGVSVYIISRAIVNFKGIFGVFLEKAPADFDALDISDAVQKIDGVVKVHHIHLWSLDGQNNIATMHVVCNGETHAVKEDIRAELEKYGIGHVTLELESTSEAHQIEACNLKNATVMGRCHHVHR